MAVLRVILLGGFGITHESGATLALPGAKARALFAYLALETGRAQPRDKLAALLWPEASRERARHNLRQLLLLIRQAVPAGVLVERGDDIAVDGSGVEVDAVEFERLTTTAEARPDSLTAAVGLYRGDLLAGLGEQSATFEEWLLAERERLRALALQVLTRLLSHHLDAGAAEPGVDIAGRLLALDPAHEPAHRALMRLYARGGRRAAALRQYQVCVAALRHEVGTDPDPETKEVYRQLMRRPSRSGGSSESRPTAPARDAGRIRGDPAIRDTPLVGRRMELARLRAAVEDWDGRLSIWVVVGEAGIGKSRLIAEVVGDAIHRRRRAVVGRCYESTRILPFGPWVDAIRGERMALGAEVTGALPPVWQAELARLFPELARAELPPASDDYLRLFEGVARLLERLSGMQPTVLVLEDVHWADEMSLRLLAFVARRSTRRLTILLTAREEELIDAPVLRLTLQELRREARLGEVKLSSLSRDETATLIRMLARRAAAEPTAFALEEVVWKTSEGNPFVALETMRALEEGSGGEASADALPLPARVRDIVAGRLDHLTPAGRHLAAVAAVIGCEFDFTLVQRAADLPEWQAAEALEELVRRGIVHGEAEGFDFTHARIRDVAYGEVLPPRRRLLHAQVVAAIEAIAGNEVDGQASVLAEHCREAELWVKALAYSRQAGLQAAARSAHAQAVTYFERALAAVDCVGRTPETVTAAIDTRFDLRTSLVALGQLDGVLRYLREAEDLIAALDDGPRRGRLSVYMAHYHLMTGALGEADAQARIAAAIAASTDDRALHIGATHYAGWARLARAEYERADECFLDVIGALDRDREQERHGLTGYPAVMARWLLAMSLADRGRFEAARRHTADALRIAEAGDHAFSRILALWGPAYVATIRGEFADAGDLYARALGIARERDIGFLAPFVLAQLGLARAGEGRAAEGVALLDEALDIFDRSPYRVFHSRFVADQGEAYLIAERPDHARRLSERARTLARDRGERGVEAWALRLAADAAVRDEDAAAAGLYRASMARATELGMQPLVAHCYLGLGRLQRRAGASGEGDAYLSHAAAMYRALDMPRWLAIAEATRRDASRAAARLTRSAPAGPGGHRAPAPRLE